MYINLLQLLLFNFAYLFFLSFLSFLSSQHFFSFIFIVIFPNWHLALVWFPVCVLLLFLTSEYNFFIYFVHWVNLLYFIFVGLFWLCSWVYMYMCVLHYFNYYLPDFLDAICLGVHLWFLVLGYLFYPPLMI